MREQTFRLLALWITTVLGPVVLTWSLRAGVVPDWRSAAAASVGTVGWGGVLVLVLG